MSGTYTTEGKRFLRREPLTDVDGLMPGSRVLDAYVRGKYGEPADMAISPRTRYRKSYVAADDVYESLVVSLVSDATRWLDVGCGRDIFPSNRDTSEQLASLAAHLVGVDPDENIFENDLLNERFQGVVEDYQTQQRFDLITLRMVAEHVVDADRCVAKLAALADVGGLVVVYTPWRWAPMSLAAAVVPFAFHNRLKRLIWDTEAQDTFPTAYRMNTRDDLARLFTENGFEETLFARVDDCSILTRYPSLNSIEIAIRNTCCRLRLPYLEFCILAAYRKA